MNHLLTYSNFYSPHSAARQPTTGSSENTYTHCDLTPYGCCPDRVTPAQGWLLEGCGRQQFVLYF